MKNMREPVAVGASDGEIDGPGRKKAGRARLVKIIISALLIAIVLSRANLSEIMTALSNSNLSVLAIAGSLTFVGAVLTATRWRVLLTVQSVSTSTRYLVGCWMVACFFNQFLPSTIGGDARRVYDSWKLGASKAGAVAAIGVDRILGLLALMLYGTISLYLSSVVFDGIPGLKVFVVLVALTLVALATLIFVPSTPFDSWAGKMVDRLPGFVAKVVRKLQQALGAYRGQGKVLAAALVLSIALQLNVILFYFLIGNALGLELKFLDYMLIVPVANVVLLLPVTINGIGLREGVFAVLLAGFGLSTSTAVAFAWASFALFLLFGLLGGLVFALQSRR